jgi:hypothetical protein
VETETRRGLVEGSKGLALFFGVYFMYGVIRNKNLHLMLIAWPMWVLAFLNFCFFYGRGVGLARIERDKASK